MIMIKKTIILTMLAASSVSAMAQRIEAKNDVIDCGNVMYEVPVTVKFELRNDGGLMTIKEVKPGCGCTAVEYPRNPIRSGEAFTVTATYDCRQMGHFFRDFEIVSDAFTEPFYIAMRGNVVKKVKNFIGDFPYTFDVIKADENNIEFDNVNRGEHPVKKINIANTSSQPISPVVMHLPNYLKAQVSPTTIAPGKQGVITISLDSKKLRDYGLAQTSVYLGANPGDKVSPDKEITVSAVLLPSFAEMTESDLAKAPQIRLSQDNLDLGNFNGKSKKSGTVVIENVGREELDISSLQMFTTGISVKLNKTKLQPGEQTKLKVTADARLIKKVRSKPRVLMITNDPLKPKVIIEILIGN